MKLPDTDALNWVLAAIGILSALVGVWLYFRPGFRRASAVADAILGEPEETDRSGKIITPARPGLVHRVTSVEEAVVEFRHLVGLVTEALGRVDELSSRVKALEDSRVEKIVHAAERAATAAASVEAFRMVNERDTEDGESRDVDELGD